MIDPIQAVLLIVVILLAVVLTILAVQVFFVLKELKKTLETINKETLPKINNATDFIDEFSHSMLKPLGLVSGFLQSTRSITPILKLITSKIKDDEKS